MDSPDSFELAVRQRTGTALLLIGTIGAVLIYIDRSGNSDLNLPMFWYRTRSLHLFFCVAAFVGGAVLLRNPHAFPAEDDSHDETHSPVFRSVVVYSRPGCHLCDEAIEKLERHASQLPDITEVNISGDTQLEQEHGEWIPVVEVDGRIRFRGQIDDTLLQRMIDAAARRKNNDVDPDPLAGSVS